MNSQQWALLSFHLAALVLGALAFGQVARRFGLPALVGEVLGGALLGPTLLGRVFPEFQQMLFPSSGPFVAARDAFARTGMLIFILTIGLGISLDEFRRIKKKALWVGCVGTFVPLALGFAMVYAFPGVIGVTPQNQFPVAVMLGSIISLSANPVIARILLDLDMFDTEPARIIMSATLVDDIVGWGAFAVLLANFGPAAKPGANNFMIVAMVLGFIAITIFGGRWLFPKVLGYIDRSYPPTALITAMLGLTFLASAVSEKLGVHAFLGAFLVGIALADATQFREKLDMIGTFAYAAFTPIFFMSMGIGRDFVAGFDLPMVLLITFVSFFGKIAGVFIGGKIAGMDNRLAFAVGCGLNARGILGIVMAAAAHENKMINDQMFVACLVMCLLTTAAAGPGLIWTLGRRNLGSGKAVAGP
jgi:Kef-type K+ transport system membrane component KefB